MFLSRRGANALNNIAQHAVREIGTHGARGNSKARGNR